MDTPAQAASFGQLLRRWRMHRGRSQLQLALQASVSTRHLSWLETGRAQPSRAMALRLAHQLDLPPRERNALLLAAGYAPLYAERPLADPALAPGRASLQRLLDAHEPWPALAVDRHWTLVAANRMVAPLLQGVAPALLAPPLNVLRVSLHPQGLGSAIANLPAWRVHVLARLERQHAATNDAHLLALLQELRALPAASAAGAGAGADADAATDADARTLPIDDPVVPLTLRTPMGRLCFITTITTFGAPHEVALSELAVETLLPADEPTAAALRALHETLPG
jgi:transcriptional regulator with XRE-family HTH domain